jgi:septal ring factor EnvC (AmiA/AmiB activator)
MTRPTAALVVLCLALGLAGCDSPTRTVETTRRQITEFQAAPNDKTQAAIEESLAKLDAQVQALEKKGDTIQADLFRSQASRLRSDFQAAKISKAFRDAKNAIQGIGDAFKDAGKIIGDTLKADETNEP